MLETRGLNRGIILTGSSTHNTRIERIWKECGKSFIHLFSRIFTHLEKEQSLELANPFHLYSLHYIYLPRIRRGLYEWMMAWNCHPMSGCGSSSPLKLRESGFLSACNTPFSITYEVKESVTSLSLENYGIDTGQSAANISQHLEEPRVHLPITSAIADSILSEVDPLFDDNDHGISSYKLCLGLFRDRGHDC